MRGIETLMREGQEPPRDRSYVMRADGDLLREIESYATEIENRTGVVVTRQAAAEALIRLGLKAAKRRR